MASAHLKSKKDTENMQTISFFKFFAYRLFHTSCKAEQPLQGMELQEKEAQKY